jgi:hypothetical protein
MNFAVALSDAIRYRCSTMSVPPDVCPNCFEPFGGTRPRFCSACGQETTIKPPTLTEFAQQFGGAYFATEGALWRTLKLLLTKPGELTRQYLAGRRKHFVLPLRLYLSISVVTLLLIRFAGGVVVGNLDNPELQAKLSSHRGTIQLALGPGRAGLKDGIFYCENLPDWICRRLSARIDVDVPAFIQRMHLVQDRIVGNIGGAMFVLMPIFAFGLWLLYRNRRLGYTEHLVFALHVHAFWFVVFALMQLPSETVGVVGLLVIVGYTVLAMRRVYGGRWLPLLARACALAAFYAMAGVVTVTLGALVALLA